ncbi:MAG: TIGR04255 family protein [Propionibacteriaceae bacterium]|nr:TIGR04255 family protein [Propionibacteriaceae bacterium]
MREREVYPNPPIVLMVAEVRHTACEPLDRKQVTRLSELVREELPLPGEEVSYEVQFSSDGAPQPPYAVTTAPRWTTRDRRTALTIRQESLTVETTQYGSYERVRALLELSLRARIAVAPPAGLERVGLRYVDEIRVPTETGSGWPPWNEWVDSALLGPAGIGEDLGLEPAAYQGSVVFSSGDDRAIVLRYGAQENPVVQSTPDLRRPMPPPGPLFKLDIDSFWLPGSEVPEFASDSILACADSLHEPVRGVFESLITNRLREEVLRHG